MAMPTYLHQEPLSEILLPELLTGLTAGGPVTTDVYRVVEDRG